MTAVVATAQAYTSSTFKKAARKVWQKKFGGEPDVAAQTFLDQVQGDALAEDLDGISAARLAEQAAEFWDWASGLDDGAIHVRTRPSEYGAATSIRRDVIEIVGPDRPFLVDSVMGEVGAQGLDVLAMFHPIVPAEPDGEGDKWRALSLIQVHVEPLDEVTREVLAEAVRAAMDDVRLATDDFKSMRAAMNMAIAHVEDANTPAGPEEKSEALEFLRWLRDDHFAFLGCRVYQFEVDEKGKMSSREPSVQPGSGMGILRDPDRQVLRKGNEPALLTPAIETFLNEPSPIIVAKANIKSRVHRRVYMDYIGVKRYREDGAVVGEARFVGLFTAEAYDRMARDVPLIRRKVRRVLERAGKIPGTHSEKKLRNIVENYPRDELFQTDEDDLLKIGLGILHLQDRPRTKLLVRRDRFDRFVSCLLFVPRDRYNSRVREQAGELIRASFEGRMSAFYPHFGDGPLARVHYIIGLNPNDHPEPDLLDLERQIVALARTWEDEFVAEGRRGLPDELRHRLTAYDHAFSAGYREQFAPAQGIADMMRIEALADGTKVGARLYRIDGEDSSTLRLKIYRRDEPTHLSEVMPVLENMGLNVIQESGFEVQRGSETDSEPIVYIHDFEMRSDALADRDVSEFSAAFEDALLAVIANKAEDDGFNRLILILGVSWREAAVLRALSRYRQQTGLDPSQAIQEEALAENPAIARRLLNLFDTRFNPALDLDIEGRKEKAAGIGKEIRSHLEKVASIDHDRVLRRLLRLLEATLRTNYFQTAENGHPKAHISFKIASREVEELPLPKPYREIFVWAPNVEGVHIRFGPVARGGLRWSDRRDDFRTEVLGLVKAQQVKNAVIVPVGSKGGFYPKQLPRSGSRDEWLAEGQSAYRTFIRGLLDITDNISEDVVEHPENVVIWDGEDPYLVVAADKGTATFSDIANGVATDEYDFWLGDAFASGGSAGYDHKKMGITARGAWESVKRHFRELGKDIQNETFTVAGVGDMSGDVFGNGMLLSRKIKLVAAFDHRDIFIDPDPADCEAAFEERKRLFELPRSSWQDYDKKLISKGGGIFPRSEKSIKLSKEIRALLGIEETQLSPPELMSAILRAPVELLWFGGIGTYVKASSQQHWEVGDKANDSIRINAAEVGAKVIGEGANLGFTQMARIEFDRADGRVNADFVDNSAGVDTSDHEVNIKILLSPLLRSGDMSREARDKLLGGMTDDVAEHVLRHNYDQTLALTLAENDAPSDVDAHERFMARLERTGRLDRAVENLPTGDGMRALKEQGMALTRPELAVLISYAKITTFDKLVASNVPDDPHFEAMLTGYFPHDLAGFEDQMSSHRLRREIISTVLANDMINLGGPTFVHRAIESTGADPEQVARAFEAGRKIFRFSEMTDRINKLDNRAPAGVQITLHREIIRLLRRQTYWLARRARAQEGGNVTPIRELIEAYRPGVDKLRETAIDIISTYEREHVEARTEAYVEAGAPKDLAHDIAVLRPLTSSSDVVDLALREDWPLESAGYVYHAAGARFSTDKLRGLGSEVSSDLHWDRLAVRRLIEDLYASQQAISASMMRFARSAGGTLQTGVEAPTREWADDLLDAWCIQNDVEAGRFDSALEELETTGAWTLSKLAIASTQLRELAQSAEP
ncbi:NAD-glutamate dehydrogenase [Hyphobacterium sp. HN65]|uniref:NAD-glutamate dehydrogenase n=1 Tax=Hyphobacterium lacteum TaxID=3116575 RepID=A0ABU7LRL4_9PROT|nr:NAD-glutamate dehydrogenase [Hyphobacterium sp. HN65]MEE2526557.1 NAD-glutamate dehydrogenase [Hyphobacterium sp. HN65]